MARPPPKRPSTSCNVVIEDAQLKLLAQIAELIELARPGAANTRSDVIREVISAGIPIVRARYQQAAQATRRS